MKKLCPFKDNRTKLGVISKRFRNSTYEFEIHFEMTPISNSPTATLMFRLLYLRNCIYGTPSALSGPHMTRNHHFIIFLIIFRKLFCNKWPRRVCHMLGNWWYYINSLNSRFERSWIFFFRYLLFKSPFSPCNPPIIGFLS